MDDFEEDALKKVRDLIGENYTNWAFCVVTEDGDLFYDFRDRWVGKALFVSAIEDMEQDISFEGIDIDWDDDDEEVDPEGEEWQDE